MKTFRAVRNHLVAVILPAALVLLALLAYSSAVYADAGAAEKTVTIGTGSGSGYVVPYSNDWNNSRTQIIYKADDIGNDGDILSVSYKVTAADPSFKVKNLRVWMGYADYDHYDYDKLSTATIRSEQTMREDELTLVYEGIPSLGASEGWETIRLDTPFEYSRDKGNLVIVSGLNTVGGSSDLKYAYDLTGEGSLDHDAVVSIYTGEQRDATVADISYDGTMPWKIRSERPLVQFVMDTSSVSADGPYAVTFDADGGLPAPETQRVVKGEKAYVPQDPEKEGYDFGGWYKGGAKYDFNTPVTAKVALKAEWTKKKYAVKWLNYDGSVLGTDAVEYEAMPSYKGETPVRPAEGGTEYIFIGWEPDIAPAAGDAEYTAKYIDAADVADKTELNKAVDTAERARAGVKMSQKGDGTDIGRKFEWVNSSIWNRLDDAITEGKSTSEDILASEEEVSSRIEAIESALNTFNMVKAQGRKELPVIEKISIDKTSGALQPANKGVYAWHIVFRSGDDASNVTTDDFNIQRKPYDADSWRNSKCPSAFYDPETSVLMAQGIPDNAEAGPNQWRFDYAGEIAVNDAGMRRIVITQEIQPDKAALDEALRTVADAQKGVKISSDGRDVSDKDVYVTLEDQDALDLAVRNAEKINGNEAVLQKQVNDAAERLNSALDAYNAAKKKGSKTSAGSTTPAAPGGKDTGSGSAASSGNKNTGAGGGNTAADKKAAAEKAAREKAAAAKKAEAKAKKVKTVTVNVKTVNKKAIDKAVKKAGGSSKYVTKIILGKKAAKISKNAFKTYKKVRTIEIRSRKLKKASVKNSLKGSNVKTVRVKVGNKKTNKKYVKKYKKIFTKKNTGRKPAVK